MFGVQMRIFTEKKQTKLTIKTPFGLLFFTILKVRVVFLILKNITTADTSTNIF
jgi:hypothetical protein